jgi:hypothetical protein
MGSAAGVNAVRLGWGRLRSATINEYKYISSNVLTLELKMSLNFSEQFQHYVVPDSGIIKDAMTSGLIVFDTNILLNAYRFAPAARKQLMSVLARVADRTWIPHQVAEEFHKNRLGVMADYDAAYASVTKPLEAAQRKLEEDITPLISQLANRTALTNEEKSHLLDLLADSTKSTMSAIEELRQGHGLGDLRTSDPILSEYQTLYGDKVGRPFSEKEYSEALKEAQHRIDSRIPPGYCDSKKTESFGDYFIWEQVLVEVSNRQISFLVFVTADAKEDWHQIVKGNTICARPELAKELMVRTKARLVILSLPSFLFHASEYLDADVSVETIRQSEEASHTEIASRHSSLVNELRDQLMRCQTSLDMTNQDLGGTEFHLAKLLDELNTSLLHDLEGNGRESTMERVDQLRLRRHELRRRISSLQAERTQLEAQMTEAVDRMKSAKQTTHLPELHHDRSSHQRP